MHAGPLATAMPYRWDGHTVWGHVIAHLMRFFNLHSVEDVLRVEVLDIGELQAWS
ncbi:hypothetical protein QEH59_10535 [Coraliomargarita sp. SDUM461004]|uniref:Uncharacterized protein n=1 Tax=Thalassobacterium sedimentorum TaxID=3041258 RepID=A0ABU1AJD9_9BACT|nr:hypothetical protein [Coraliomargarita sp. SDUM461004]